MTGDSHSAQAAQAGVESDMRTRTLMTARTIELLSRNLYEVFREDRTTQRRAIIEEFYTDDCVLYVPSGVFVGHQPLDKFVGELRVTHPQYVYTPQSEPRALHNSGILAWGSGPAGEPTEYARLDVVVMRDGKIATMYVLLNPRLL